MRAKTLSSRKSVNARVEDYITELQVQADKYRKVSIH